jgi:hypothetical protein
LLLAIIAFSQATTAYAEIREDVVLKEYTVDQIVFISQKERLGNA